MGTCREAGWGLLAMGVLFALVAGCGGTEWENSDVAVLTLVLPDTVEAGQPIPARITGVCGCEPCCRFDGLTATRDGTWWVLEPRSRCRQRPKSPCPPCDHFFDEVVTLPGQDSGVVRVRTAAYGDDLADSVVVLGR
jgi:hypothetical protein